VTRVSCQGAKPPRAGVQVGWLGERISLSPIAAAAVSQNNREGLPSVRASKAHMAWWMMIGSSPSGVERMLGVSRSCSAKALMSS
jgi:hypothetical protein